MKVQWTWVHRGVLVGLFIGFLAFLGLFEGGERLSYDARAYLSLRLGDRNAPLPITVVAIDDASLATVGRWPWPRRTLATLVECIDQAGAAVIGLDLVLSEPSSGDAVLAAALPAGRVVLPVFTQGQQWLEPVPELAHKSTLGHIEVHVDSDSVVRSVPAVRNGVPPLGLVAARLFTGRAYPSGPNAIWLNLHLKPGSKRLALSELTDTVSAADVMAGRFPRELLEGRLVLVGMTATVTAGLDAYVTPLRPLGAVPGIYMHAGLAAAEVQGMHVRRPGRGWELFLTLIAGLAGSMLIGQPLWLAPVVVALVYTVMSLVMFARHAFWLPWVAPMLAFYSTVAWAYMAKRWDLERERQALRRLFARYVPPEVMPELLRHSDELGLAGVQRDVTVLFADIRGFTALAEPLAPVHVMQVLNLYLEAMAAAVRQHGGMVDKYLGDGLMAVFGAPVPHDHAVQAAVMCAIDMQARIRQLHPPQGLVPSLLPIGIGIHVGEAVLGTVGGRERLEYTAMGDVVNVAARLEEMAPGGSILVSGDVVERLADSPLHTMCQPLGTKQVRGKRRVLTVYAVQVAGLCHERTEPR